MRNGRHDVGLLMSTCQENFTFAIFLSFASSLKFKQFSNADDLILYLIEILFSTIFSTKY